MKRVFPVSVLSSRRLLFSIALTAAFLLSLSVWALVGPTTGDNIEEAARLYSRVEELWRAKASGQIMKIASMMVPASRERLFSQSQLPIGGAVSQPASTNILVEAITISQDGKLGKAEISFDIIIPGAPVLIPHKQTEVWEKIDSQWYYSEQKAMKRYLDTAVTGVVDVGVTDVVDTGVTSSVESWEEGENPLAVDTSERFERHRIASYWASQAIQFLDSGRDEDALQLLNEAIRIGAPFIWERLIVAERLLKTDTWRKVVPQEKDKVLELVPVLVRFGNFEEATRILEQSLLKNTNDAQLLEKLGDTYSAMGETDKAVATYVKTIPASAWSDDIHRIQWKIGQEYFTAGSFQNAISALAGAAATDPMAETLRPVLSLLADALFADEDFKHALAVYRVVTSFASAPPSAMLGRIRAARALSELSELVLCTWLADTSNDEIREEIQDDWPKLRRHIKRREKSASNSYTTGVLAESLGETKAAQKAFQKALSSREDHAGSIVHLYAGEMSNSYLRKLRDRLSFLEDRFGLASEEEVRALANAVSRAPGRTQTAGGSPDQMQLLFSDGNLSRVVLVSGQDRDDVFAGAAGTGCMDGATIALDVAEAGPYFLSFDITPFGLQSQFEPVIVTLLDGEPLQILPLQFYRTRFGQVLQVSAGLHSLKFLYDAFSLTTRPGAAESDLRRFLLSHVSLMPVSELSITTVGDTGGSAPVDIVSVSGGAYQNPIGDIFVDGVQTSCKISGYNVVAIEPETGAIIDSASFATAADRRAESKFEVFVDSLKPSTIVAVAVLGDGAYKADDTITQCLEALGAANGLVQDGSWAEEVSRIAGVPPKRKGKKTRGMLFPERFRRSYALIGAKGAKKGTASEMTGWERSVVAVVSDNEKTRQFLDALSPCEEERWSECAERLTSFFSSGNLPFINRLPLLNEDFVEHVIPRIQSDEPTLFLALGKRFEECSMFNEALAAFDRSVAVSENSSAYFAKAHLLAKLRRFSAAYETYISGTAASPIPKLRRLKEIVEDVETSGVETIFVTASNEVSCHFVNGIRTVLATDAWTLSGIEPESGELLESKMMSKDDQRALARAIDAFPEGTIIALAFSGHTPAKIETVLANAIQSCIRRQSLPRKDFKNIVLVGCRLKKPKGFYNASFDEASLMLTWD